MGISAYNGAGHEEACYGRDRCVKIHAVAARTGFLLVC